MHSVETFRCASGWHDNPTIQFVLETSFDWTTSDIDLLSELDAS